MTSNQRCMERGTQFRGTAHFAQERSIKFDELAELFSINVATVLRM